MILRDQEINADAIAAAKKAGATGVVIKFGSEGAGELAASATELGLEAMWEVTSKEEFAGATEAGNVLLLSFALTMLFPVLMQRPLLGALTSPSFHPALPLSNVRH